MVLLSPDGVVGCAVGRIGGAERCDAGGGCWRVRGMTTTSAVPASTRPSDWPDVTGVVDLVRDDRPHPSAGLECWQLHFHVADAGDCEYSGFVVFVASAYRESEDEVVEVVRGHVVAWGLYDVESDRHLWDCALDRDGLLRHAVTQPNVDRHWKSLRRDHRGAPAAGEPSDAFQPYTAPSRAGSTKSGESQSPTRMAQR